MEHHLGAEDNLNNKGDLEVHVKGTKEKFQKTTIASKDNLNDERDLEVQVAGSRDGS